MYIYYKIVYFVSRFSKRENQIRLKITKLDIVTFFCG